MDLIFFWLSKLFWIALSPDAVLVLLVWIGLILLLAGAVKKAKIILCLVALAMGALTLLPLGDFLLAPLENRFPANPMLPARVDGLICLGGAENAFLTRQRGQAQVKASAERLLTFVRLMNAYPGAMKIFSGGSGSLAHPDEKDADVAKMVLADLGLDISGIIFESGSRNTYENGKACRAIATPKSGQAWVLITSAGHMPRAVGVFRNLGWEVIPYPVDFQTPLKTNLTLEFAGNLDRFKKAVREWAGLAVYYLTGKTSGLFPGPKAS